MRIGAQESLRSPIAMCACSPRCAQVNNLLKFLMQLYFKPTTAKMLSNLKVRFADVAAAAAAAAGAAQARQCVRAAAGDRVPRVHAAALRGPWGRTGCKGSGWLRACVGRLGQP